MCFPLHFQLKNDVDCIRCEFISSFSPSTLFIIHVRKNSRDFKRGQSKLNKTLKGISEK